MPECTVSYQEFLIRFPEFSKADRALVEAVLSESSREISHETWGNRYCDAVKFTTARALALSPLGRNMRMVNEDGSTVYDADLMRMRRAAASGHRVI